MVCVDASIFVHRVTGTAPAVDALWDTWSEGPERLVAPPIFRAEVSNGLYQLHKTGRLSREDALGAMEVAVRRVEIAEPDGLSRSAIGVAIGLGMPATYDAHYVALAEELGIELFTADRRLADLAGQRVTVHLMQV